MYGFLKLYARRPPDEIRAIFSKSPATQCSQRPLSPSAFVAVVYVRRWIKGKLRLMYRNGLRSRILLVIDMEVIYIVFFYDVCV